MRFLHSLSAWCYHLMKPWTAAAATVLMVLFMVIVLPQEADRSSQITGSSRSPDTSLFYTPSELYDIAEEYGEEGRAYYIRSRFSFDIIWPAVYLLFLVSMLSQVYRTLQMPRAWKLLNMLPAAAVLLDFLENTTVSLVMFQYPQQMIPAAAAAGVFTFLKWVFIALSFTALAAGGLLQLRSRIMRSPR